jgi:hypothetical protein
VKKFLSALLLAIAIGSPVDQARGLEWPSPQQLSSSDTYERLGAWRQVEHLFSVERLSPGSFAGYAAALAEGDCDLALTIVWDAFIELEPAFAGRARFSEVARAWRRSVLPYRFPEHVFCEERRYYLLLAPRLAKRGISSLPETAILGHAERRNTDVMPSYQALLIDTLQVLFNLAHSDNPGAIRFILEQDQNGRFVKLTGEQRLSLLVRLARLGEAEPDERAQAMMLAQEVPLSTVAAARAYAARAVEPEFERWQAYQRRLRALSTRA